MDIKKNDYPVIGKAWFSDVEGLCNWYQESAADWFRNIWTGHIAKMHDKTEAFELLQNIHYRNDIKRAGGDYFQNSRIEELQSQTRELSRYLEACSLSLDLLYEDDQLVVLQYGNYILMIPIGYARTQLLKDYSALPPSQFRHLAGFSIAGDQEIVSSTGLQALSQRQLQEQLQAEQEKQRALMEERESIANGQHQAVADLQRKMEEAQRELEQKQQELMAELEAKKLELSNKMKEMERQLFVLDGQIYSIRCFLGEAVEFCCIRDGASAPQDTPVVLFQKLRYLDEELGQIASIYDIDGGDIPYVEEFLKYNDVAFERFCPSRKCIVLLRISKDSKTYGAHEKWANMLDNYEVYHGTRIGILIRNGDQLYAGWTDHTRVMVKEDMFYTPAITTEPGVVLTEDDPEETFFDKKRRLEREQLDYENERFEKASRIYLFSVLQGLLERRELIELPESVNVMSSFYEPNPYIVVSAAENWLEDDRYGSFADIVKRCNSIVKEGHMVLTVQSVSPDFNNMHARHEAWNNPRGRGDANRVHDVRASDKTIYRINLVEAEEEYRRIRYLYPSLRNKEKMNEARTICRLDETPQLAPDCQIISDDIVQDFKYYISLEKNQNWKGETGARTNLQIYPEEFINLTFLNSSWLLYVISSKKLGGWRVGGKTVNYAYAITYLNIALQYVREREQLERELILAVYPQLDALTDWPALLSEWKLLNIVREITPYQAKRFAKWLGGRKEITE